MSFVPSTVSRTSPVVEAIARTFFLLRHKPYLHFHESQEGEIYADVWVGGGTTADFEPVGSTPTEREVLLRRVRKQVRRVSRR